MAGAACVVYDPSLTRYNFGPSHPMSPIRVDLTMRLAEALGVTDSGGLGVVPAPMADDELLTTVHTEHFVETVRKISDDPDRFGPACGVGTEDTPAFPGVHTASAHIVGATVEAARQVWTGQVDHAVSIAGGLHHAMPDHASGFCVYNDLAVAIRWLLEQGAERVAYVDVDVHHGDGVEAVFYDDPRVLTISLHETGQFLFPGTGFPNRNGGPGAEGTAVNVALPPGTSDPGWLRAFHTVVPPLLREFSPDVLVTQHGCDSHTEDPLAHLMLSVDGQRASYLALHDLAHEVAGGRWVATGGGGYAIVDVVPRVWSHLLSIAGGSPLALDREVPEPWREYVLDLLGQRAPRRMGEGKDISFRTWEQGYDPSNWLDRAVMETRRQIFPYHGIAPEY